MKIGVSSYSFYRYYKENKITDLTFPAKAKEMGFDSIEYATLNVPEGENIRDWAKKIRQASDDAGFEISNYTIGADFLNGSEGNLEKEIERVKGEVDIAEILGAKGMRHDAAWGFKPEYTGPRSFDAVLPRLADGCRAVTEYAAKKGIRTMVENHGFFVQDSERVEKLICAVNHPNFGWLVDMGNFTCVDEFPGRALGIAMKYAFHVHAKDFLVKDGNGPNPGESWFLSRAGQFRRGAIIGHGEVPFVQCLRLMKNAGYDGVLSVEFESIEDNELGIRLGRENLLRYLKIVSE